ncbi:glycosyltransferase [Avibacterium sp. 21-586]|uniref:glycosyltransferase family 2 protein n=1 Tax=Avibacterium sp. 21-586 TaxID=2911534 RepID=UPI002246C17B|nr:glycosyltransferase family 2 protein [Avibacterium sp. 21-586]MCW9711219.1 glycosyltransferase [Avibacterium sp. 21-586]
MIRVKFPTIDVIMPCYNCSQTLARAVYSVIEQPYLGKLWLIDDVSTDESYELAKRLYQKYPGKICIEQMPKNSGVAKTRNWGALQSNADIIAFLDADDAYEERALENAAAVFAFKAEINVLRLSLKPVNLPERYTTHPAFGKAWQYMEMTGAGNLVIKRSFFLACGGFPQDPLFRQLGGEDGAFGLATTKLCLVGTLFNEAGVLHYCHDGMHAQRLLNAILFNQHDESVTEEKLNEANQITASICRRMMQLKDCLNYPETGVLPLHIERTE